MLSNSPTLFPSLLPLVRDSSLITYMFIWKCNCYYAYKLILRATTDHLDVYYALWDGNS